jgi:hypothetical protein
VADGRQIIFDKSWNRITVMERNGDVIEELHAPRRTFDGYAQRFAWGVGQAAYFRSYAAGTTSWSTRRRVHLRRPDRSPDSTRTLVAVDLDEIRFSSAWRGASTPGSSRQFRGCWPPRFT